MVHGNYARQVTCFSTPGNQACRDNFSPCEQKVKTVLAKIVSHMLNVKAQNKFYDIKVPESNRNGKKLVKLILVDSLCHNYGCLDKFRVM